MAGGEGQFNGGTLGGGSRCREKNFTELRERLPGYTLLAYHAQHLRSQHQSNGMNRPRSWASLSQMFVPRYDRRSRHTPAHVVRPPIKTASILPANAGEYRR